MNPFVENSLYDLPVEPTEHRRGELDWYQVGDPFASDEMD